MTDDFVRCPHCQKVLCTRGEGGLTAVERAKQLRERQLKHLAEAKPGHAGGIGAWPEETHRLIRTANKKDTCNERRPQA